MVTELEKDRNAGLKAAGSVPPTVEDLNAQVERLTTGDLAQAQRDLDSAKSTFGKAQKSASVDELLEMAGYVRDAQKAVDTVNASIDVARKRIQVAEWEVTTAELREAGTLIASAIRDALSACSDVLKKFNVTGFTSAASGIGTPELVISPAKWQGPNIPTAPKGVKRGGAGRGGAKSVPLTVNGTEYPSASAACKVFFPDSGPLNRASIISKLATAGHTVSG